MTGEIKTVERLKTKLLGELYLWTPADVAAYWKQVPWPKPNLVQLAKNTTSPLAVALNLLAPEITVKASELNDPFGWLLEAVDVTAWSEYCHTHDATRLARVWLAAASQLCAERRLIHKAHGWGDTLEELRRHADTPDMPRYADEYFIAQLRHAKEKRRDEMLATPGLDERLAKARQEDDEGFLRRLRRAKKGAGRRRGVSLAGMYAVQYWLELPQGFPGLCFFSDTAFHALLRSLRLSMGNADATKQMRVRCGLIQAGAKRHLVERVKVSAKTISLLAFDGGRERMLHTFDSFTWKGRQWWPRSA